MFIIKFLKYLTKPVDRRIEHDLILVVIISIVILKKLKPKFRLYFLLFFLFLYRRTFYLVCNVLLLGYVINYKKYDLMVNISHNLLCKNMNMIENFKKIPQENSIIICNYPSEIQEYLVQWLIPKKITIIVIKEIGNFMKKIGADVLLVDQQTKNNYNKLKKEIENKIKSNSVFFYLNDPNSKMDKYDLGKVKTGVINIAHELKIPITPIVVDSTEHIFGAIREQDFRIEVGETVIIKNPKLYINKIKKYYRKTINKFKMYK
jgi:hypothetical protein